MTDIEPTLLATFERSYGREQMAFERSDWLGKATFWLRVRVRNRRGVWTWAAARPSSSDRYWQSFSLKPLELRRLGLALVAAADELDRQNASAQPAEPRPRRPPSPKERRSLEAFDAENPVCKGSTDDESNPF